MFLKCNISSTRSHNSSRVCPCDDASPGLLRVTASMRKPAFTLMETIGAIIILAVAIPPMMMTLQHVSQMRATPVTLSRARWLAVEKLEEILADSYSDERGYDYVTSANYLTETPISSDPDYSRSVSIIETGPDLSSSGSGYKTITLEIEWQSMTPGETHSLTIASVITEDQ